MSNFLQDPNDPPVAEAPPPETDADGNLPWEQAPAEGYDAATTGGEGESAESEEEEQGEVSSADGGEDDPDDGEVSSSQDEEQEQEQEQEQEPEPEPTLEASAEAGGDPPPFYLPPDDQLTIDYEVQVQPPPADRSEASLYKHEAGQGEPLSTHTLVTSGTGQLVVPLTDRTIEDSPLFVRFEFEKEGASRPLVSIDRAFSLAEPEAKTIDAAVEVVAGQAHALKVATWGALAYDRPGQGTWFEAPEVDPAKVSAEQKADVRWKVDGAEVPDLTGDEVEHTFAEDLAGKKVEVVAFRKEEHAKLDVFVGKVSIHGSSGGSSGGRGRRTPAPKFVPLEGDIQLKAFLDPAELTGATFTWESSSDKVTLTPGEGGVVTARGVTESEEEDDVTLTAKATVNGVEWSATHTVSVCKVPQIKARDGTSDPSIWAPLWHYVYLKAVVPDGMTGRFAWEASDKLRIVRGANRDDVIVMARRLSDAAEDQWVKVTFTPRGGEALPAVEHKLTAVSVVFSKDANQRYGFDNMDNATGQAPRLSVKKNDHTTVRVTMRGPGFTSEKVEFASENRTIAEAVAPEAGQTEFALRVNGKAQNKAEVALRVVIADGDRVRCASLNVCVYKQFEVTCTVYRVHDSTVPATALGAFDLPAAQTLMNDWYKAAVVRCTLTDGGLIDCNYDKNSNGMCELRCRATSQEEEAVKTAIGAAAGTRAVIVKDVNWRFQLTADVAIGDTSVTLDQADFMNVGNTYAIRDSTGAVKENVTVGSLTAGAPATLTVNPALTVAHAAGSYIDWPLGGRSGNPAWIEVHSHTKMTCILAHELGHEVLRYKDLNQAGLIMNYYAQNTRDLTVRYRTLTHHYDSSGSESQWEMIPR